ncbi:MAG: cation:dicarboxylase symporter family transporter, partial [Novosphingobium sp.]
MAPPEETSIGFPEIRVPALWTFIALIAGLLVGLLLRGSAAETSVLAVARPLGALWLRALQMTILPLVAALLFTGVVQTVAAAQAGALARRTLGLFALVLTSSTVFAALVVPPLLGAFPIPVEATAALGGMTRADPGAVPGLAEVIASLVPVNIVNAAAKDAMLPVIVFFTLFALAATRLPPAQRDPLAGLFAAVAAAMMVVIGWVLKLAPLGVFALGFAVAAQSGSAVIAALAHYIGLVSAIGAVVLAAGYVLAVAGARLSLGAFARAMIPVQTVAFSTQSSLASLPAMLAACRTLGVSQARADFVLPLAVALFRATGPAMNLAVAIYVAWLTGTPITTASMAAGVGVALLTTLGSVSLPGTISFVTAIGPIALAMGVPIEPLA